MVRVLSAPLVPDAVLEAELDPGTLALYVHLARFIQAGNRAPSDAELKQRLGKQAGWLRTHLWDLRDAGLLEDEQVHVGGSSCRYIHALRRRPVAPRPFAGARRCKRCKRYAIEHGKLRRPTGVWCSTCKQSPQNDEAEALRLADAQIRERGYVYNLHAIRKGSGLPLFAWVHYGDGQEHKPKGGLVRLLCRTGRLKGHDRRVWRAREALHLGKEVSPERADLAE